jgi:hypothetical protein
MNDKFWIVWLPNRGLPKVQHSTPSKAIDEAQRIAGCEKRPVYVCECIGVATPQSPPVVWTDFRPANRELSNSNANPSGGTSADEEESRSIKELWEQSLVDAMIHNNLGIDGLHHLVREFVL